MPKTLRGRLVLGVLLPALLAFVALIALAVSAARSTLELELGARLRHTAAATAAQLPSGLIARFAPENTRTRSNLMARLEKVHHRIECRRVFLVDLEGRSLVDTAPDAPAPGQLDRALVEDQIELARVGRGQSASSVLYSAGGTRFMRGFAPVFHQDKVVAVVGVEASAASFDALDAMGAYLTGTGTVALVLLALVALYFGRAVTAPLKALDEAARRIGDGELDATVEIGRGADELRHLGATMESMRVALLQRDRELQLMLGGIAHEVRNPLGGMALFTGLLREDLHDRPDELALLARVEKELSALERVVEEFLSFARREPPSVSPVALSELVEAVADHVQIPVRLDGETTLQVDRQQLRRLLLNLVKNAAQAGATQVEITALDGGFEVTDDGPGVPEQSVAHIFDAFFTSKEKGTGLGLALCRKIARAHGGELKLLNPGVPGARFELTGLSPPHREA